MNLEIAVRARKEKNFNLSRVHLEQNLGCQAGIGLVKHVNTINFNNPQFFLSSDKASCLRQGAKLCYLLKSEDGLNNKAVAVKVLCGIANIGMLSGDHVDLWKVSSRSFCTLAKWLRRDAALLDSIYPDVVSSTPDAISLSQILAYQPVSTEVEEHSLLVPEAATDSDMVIGRLLKMAVAYAPEMAKAWHAFANWSLELGEKVFASSVQGQLPLTASEEAMVREVTLTSGLTEAQVQDLVTTLTHIHLKQSKGEIEFDKAEFMRKELKEYPALKDVDQNTIEAILYAWNRVQQRAFFYHEMAAKAYFQFIALSFGSEKEERVISATLRLLQLVVRHSLELQECLQNGLAETPSSAWKAIIPQLFSRLNHPVKIVRNRISELLSRIAEDFPNLVIYPAVVGSMSASSQVSKIFDGDQDQDGGHDDGVGVGGGRELQSAHEKIVDVLNKVNADSVWHVNVLVSELQRVSLLWDELWHGTIQQHHAEVTKRVKKMEDEVKRLNTNEALDNEEKERLVREKYNIIFKPLLYMLTKIEAITQKPNSPSEVHFDKKYGAFIADMMSQLRDPVDPSRPREVWSLLEHLQGKLTHKLHRRVQLSLDDISPTLANLRASHIPLPGHKGLTVDHFDHTWIILPTKTKPKRISLKASNGKTYAYLFKGLEDLHLDERIMQFLTITNSLMRSRGSDYRARHYSVVPLGPRSGIIQWVEGAVPLFSLYKKWQHRRQFTLELIKKTANSRSSNITQKPADQFYNKLVPLLRDQGINNLDNRKEWPVGVLRQVLLELVDETPDNLISQELWLASQNSDDWYRLSTNLTRSIAVMSVIGYIIGLGDRHLDNLLVDFQTGEIIHIDYNVCFEKGTKLRIPERVPCRLTQNIVKVFGFSGVDGVFRHSCEHTLETLRTAKETLLTLLEAFM